MEHKGYELVSVDFTLFRRFCGFRPNSVGKFYNPNFNGSEDYRANPFTINFFQPINLINHRIRMFPTLHSGRTTQVGMVLAGKAISKVIKPRWMGRSEKGTCPIAQRKDETMFNKSVIAHVGAVMAGALMLGVASTANAGFIEYTSRATWLGAIGGATGGENFNGFGADTSFNGSSVALASGMTIGTQTASTHSGYNKVDIVPLTSGESDVNGTANARIFNTFGSGGSTFPFITFATGILAFGADFKNLNDVSLRTRIQLFDGITLLTTLTPSTVSFGTNRFWGFEADAGETITEIRFTRVLNDVFGIDDIEIRDVAVPEPATLALFGLGLAGLGFTRRKRSA